MSEENVIIFVTLTPKPGKEADLEALLRGMCAPSRAEVGCITYNLYRRAKGGPLVHLLECWRNASALDLHREMPHYKDFRARIGDLVEGPPAPVFLQRIDALS
jgi:quinol monooxygenase YgiN